MQIGQKRQSGPERTQREGSRTVKGWYKALEDLVWLTQLGLNMLLPLVMCLGGCWWAVSHWGWPMWVYLPAVLLGLAARGAELLGLRQRAARPLQKGQAPPDRL